MVICPEWDADLHMVQLMLLPLTVSCFSKIQIGFTFLVPADPGSPGKGAVKWACVCDQWRVHRHLDITYLCQNLMCFKLLVSLSVLICMLLFTIIVHFLLVIFNQIIMTPLLLPYFAHKQITADHAFNPVCIYLRPSFSLRPGFYSQPGFYSNCFRQNKILFLTLFLVPA